jgi:hypothetical protein
VYTKPRLTAALHVREGDEVATFASTGELLPTYGALTNAERSGNIAWHPVASVFVQRFRTSIDAADGRYWDDLDMDATVIIREPIAA